MHFQPFFILDLLGDSPTRNSPIGAMSGSACSVVGFDADNALQVYLCIFQQNVHFLVIDFFQIIQYFFHKKQ